MTDEIQTLAERVADLANAAGTTVAVAESLTGGQVSAALAAAPDASTWFRGAVVAYASEVKHELLDVPPGPVVSAESATAMAASVRRLLGAGIAVAVTGSGGPDPQDGQPPGTVFLAVATDREGRDPAAVLRRFDGDEGPAAVCRSATAAALRLVLATLRRDRSATAAEQSAT